jgi:ribulose 1,5-bisphosphate carboxylase large subunit-like protein
VARFARLLGGDYFRTGVLGGYLVGGTPEELHSLTRVLTEPLPGIREMAPVLSGGLKPDNLGENLQAFGTDLLALAGTGLTRHPQGIAFAVSEMLRVAAEVSA